MSFPRLSISCLLSALILASTALVLLSAGVSRAQEEKKKGPQTPEGLKALQHPDAKVRYRACATLARLGPLAKFAVPELREALHDAHPVVRVKAAEALWKVEKTSARILLPVLLNALKDKNAEARAAAPGVIALLGTKAKSALPALVARLSDKDATVRLETILALGELGPIAAAAAPNLLALAGDESFALLGPTVAATLSSMGDKAVPSLLTALKDKSPARRLMAANALAGMDPAPADAAAALAETLGDTDVMVRYHTARALGRIGTKARVALPRLQMALKDDAPAVCIAAALASWQIDGKTTRLPVLRRALTDDKAAVRESACQALRAMGPAAKEAVPTLRKALKDRDEAVRLAAAEAAGAVGRSAASAVSEIRALLKDEDPLVRLASAFALWQIAGTTKEALPVLIDGLADSGVVVPRRAVQLLGAMKGDARPALPVLLDVYEVCREEEDSPLRSVVADALRNIDAKAAAKVGIR